MLNSGPQGELLSEPGLRGGSSHSTGFQEKYAERAQHEHLVTILLGTNIRSL